jgi:hypothetical protein
MITTQTDSRNVYCIDNDSKYISLIHPIMQNNKDIDFNKRYNKEDVNYYAKKMRIPNCNSLAFAIPLLYYDIPPPLKALS